MAFDGFTPDAFAFYAELEANNERPWWLANKARYDEQVRAPFEALGEELEPVASSVKIYRPYRDVRFSHDKTPYKTRQGLFAQRAPGIGWFLNLDASGVWIGGGFFGGVGTAFCACCFFCSSFFLLSSFFNASAIGSGFSSGFG